MEGIIPYVYRMIVQQRQGRQLSLSLNDSPSSSYIMLPGDSGRFRTTDTMFFFSSPTAASVPAPAQLSPHGSRLTSCG
ncbi:hypothetical protein FCM35_KLT05360 [Carex littledalei]|uniref:Uncharacterized protein n=1 Tax=Carex littledalei TaxID=544730 RepID=A0A833VP60_9POAL|nr:hypothetical protein FCM35_KLT05360 [Carex littledalei]